MDDENTPIIVTSNQDFPLVFATQGTTLREAIEIAEATDGADTIVFQLAAGTTINLSSQLDDFAITDDLTVELGSITLDRSVDDAGTINNDRFFSVTDDASLTLNGGTLVGGDTDDNGGAILVDGATLIINGTTFTNNTTDGDGGAIFAENADVTVNGGSFEANTADDGGAIEVASTNLTIDATFFDANVADGLGGAVTFSSFGAEEEALEVTNSSFLANEGGFGGAIYMNSSSSQETGNHFIENATFAQNIATNSGGAVHNNNGGLSIIGSTISENQAASGGGVSGFGDAATVIHIGSSIIAGNIGTSSAADIGSSSTTPVDTAFVSLGHNLIGDGTLPASAGAPFVDGENGDIVGTADTPLDAGLNDLTITDTGVYYTLADDSAALNVIDANDPSANISTQLFDQRGDGFLRAADAFTDIGAIEAQDPTPFFTTAPDTLTLEEALAEGFIGVTDLQGGDLVDAEGFGLTYAFADGENDNGAFNIDAETGVITFITTSDFEDPSDRDRNNTYLIQVLVRDQQGFESEVHDLNLTITDYNEPIVLSGLTDTLSATQGQTHAIDLSDLVIDNPEGDDVIIDVLLRVQEGQIRATQADDVEVDQSGDQLVILSGPILAITAYLAEADNVFYTGPDGNIASDTLTVTANEVVIFGGQLAVDIDIDPASGAITINGGTSGFVTGGASADTIITGDDETYVFAGSGDDVVAIVGDNSGASGDDGNDIIGALNGDHFIEGGAGEDILVGGIGVDDIDGGSGNDVIRGDVSTFLGEGDVISGGTGDDLIEGGLGADTFIFATNDGNDTIGTIDINFANPEASTVTGADFDSGIDMIELDAGFGYNDANDAFANVSDVNGNAVFSDQGTTITFEGLTTSDLSADDFILA